MTLDILVTEEEIKAQNGLSKRQYGNLLNVCLARLPEGSNRSVEDLVTKYSLLFSSVYHSVVEKIEVSGNVEDFSGISPLAASITSKTILYDLELENEQGKDQTLSLDMKSDTNYFNPSGSNFTTVKLALEGMLYNIQRGEGSVNKVMFDFFKSYHADMTNMAYKNNPKLGKSLAEIKCQIGPHQFKGLVKQNRIKKSAKKGSIEVQEKNQFHTPLEHFIVPKDKVLPRNRIIGNHEIIDYLERMTKCLFMYNTQANANVTKEEGIFRDKIILHGLPGGGKSAVCFYLMDYAEKFNRDLGRDLKITKFQFESSFKQGSIQKLKSQFKQVTEENKIFLIFQDEIDQYFKRSEGNSQESNHQTIKELCKFLEGEYASKGNYLFVSTVNDMNNLSLDLRGRFHYLEWSGAETGDEKSRLIQYKLEKGISSGYVKVTDNEFLRLGKLCYNNNLTGRDVTNVCGKVQSDYFQWNNLGKLWEVRHDYAEQKVRIGDLYNDVTYKSLEKEFLEIIKEKGQAKKNSKLFRS